MVEVVENPMIWEEVHLQQGRVVVREELNSLDWLQVTGQEFQQTGIEGPHADQAATATCQSNSHNEMMD